MTTKLIRFVIKSGDECTSCDYCGEPLNTYDVAYERRGLVEGVYCSRACAKDDERFQNLKANLTSGERL